MLRYYFYSSLSEYKKDANPIGVYLADKKLKINDLHISKFHLSMQPLYLCLIVTLM